MKRLFFTVILGIAFFGAIGQTVGPELVSSAGESFNNTSYQLDWSIGECVTATYSNGSYLITQGFHQNSYVITAVEDLAKDINITVYPNPTSDFISLRFSTTEILRNVKLTVTDISGKLLQQSKVTSDQEQLNFSNYAKGVYFLNVKRENHLIKSFKIIKN